MGKQRHRKNVAAENRRSTVAVDRCGRLRSHQSTDRVRRDRRRGFSVTARRGPSAFNRRRNHVDAPCDCSIRRDRVLRADRRSAEWQSPPGGNHGRALRIQGRRSSLDPAPSTDHVGHLDASCGQRRCEFDNRGVCGVPRWAVPLDQRRHVVEPRVAPRHAVRSPAARSAPRSIRRSCGLRLGRR